MVNNMNTPDFKHFLIFITRYFFPSKRPGLKDSCLFFEMEEHGEIQRIRKWEIEKSIPIPESQNKSNPDAKGEGLDLF